MKSGTTMWVAGIWGTGPKDVFAVGEKGLVLHYDGKSWSKMKQVSHETLLDVWGIGPKNVYAVGMYGTLLHYRP